MGGFDDSELPCPICRHRPRFSTIFRRYRTLASAGGFSTLCLRFCCTLCLRYCCLCFAPRCRAGRISWKSGCGSPLRRRAALPHLAMIGMIETRVERNGAVSRERRYYLSSAMLDAKTFAAAARAHWGVENRLHWVLDVVFHDDLARLRSLNEPQNMAVVKHMAMNLVRNPKDKHSLKVRRKLANLNPDYLETLIRQTAPLT